MCCTALTANYLNCMSGGSIVQVVEPSAQSCIPPATPKSVVFNKLVNALKKKSGEYAMLEYFSYPTVQKSLPSKCHDWTVDSVFWKTISTKSCRAVPRTEVPSSAGPAGGLSWMDPTVKTSGMLK